MVTREAKCLLTLSGSSLSVDLGDLCIADIELSEFSSIQRDLLEDFCAEYIGINTFNEKLKEEDRLIDSLSAKEAIREITADLKALNDKPLNCESDR